MGHMKVLLEVELILLKIVSNLQSHLFSGKQLSKALRCNLLSCNCSRTVIMKFCEEIMTPAFLQMLLSIW
jgi:hypothetical protein